MPPLTALTADTLVAALLGGVIGVVLRRGVRRGSHRRPDEAGSPMAALRWMPTAGAAAFAVVTTGYDGRTAVLLAAASVWLLTLSAIDVDVHRLPNALTLPAYPVLLLALVADAAASPEPDWAGVIRAVMGGSSLLAGYATAHLLPRCRGRAPGIGLGDVKLAGPLGMLLAWLGWPELALGAYAGFVISGLVALALLLRHRAGPSTAIAHGPAMAAGALTAITAHTALLIR